jgi:hypothetical protein
MRVLVACEFSGVVRDAFIRAGHDAWSCDLLPSEAPGPHIQDDALEVMRSQPWDLMIAHPPCTDLAVSGARHFKRKGLERIQRSIDFFNAFMWAAIPKICIENPVGLSSRYIRPPNQVIQPWQFGDEAQKTTHLWLVGLPNLKPTNIVGKGEMVKFASGKVMPKWYADASDDGHKRSRTFQGIADAMAAQWG